MEVKPGYKQTEAGTIPEDWEVKRLADVVTFLDGKRRPVKDSDRAKMRGSIPYYGASGVVDYVNDYLFDDELILLGEDGENILSRNCRLAFRISGKSWVNNHAHVLKPLPAISIGFLTDYLESLNYEQYNSGTAQPKLNKLTCSNIPVALPPTKFEQDVIAEALSNADALIQSLKQLISKKRLIKQGAMQELLTGKRRLHGFANEEVGYKQTEVGVIPEGWEVKRLADVVTFLDGKRRPVKDSERAKMRGSIPYYGASGIVDYVNDYLFDDELILLGEDGENILSRNCRLAFRVSGKVWVNNHAHVLKPHSDINIVFLTDYLESVNYEQYNSGTAQPKLNKVACSNIPIVLPPLTEQEAIAAVLADMDAEIAALEAKLEKARQVKQGMMQELLTGRIRLVGTASHSRH